MVAAWIPACSAPALSSSFPFSLLALNHSARDTFFGGRVKSHPTQCYPHRVFTHGTFGANDRGEHVAPSPCQRLQIPKHGHGLTRKRNQMRAPVELFALLPLHLLRRNFPHGRLKINLFPLHLADVARPLEQ